MFRLEGQLNIDKSKPSILFIESGKDKDYTNIYGTSKVIKQQLKDQYNIITMGVGVKLTDNYYAFTRERTTKLLRKGTVDNYIEINQKTLYDWITEALKDLPQVDYVILGTNELFRLQLMSFVSKNKSQYLYDKFNEFFDYLGDDEEILKIIDEENKDLVDNWDLRISPMAFSLRATSLFMRTVKILNDTGRIKHKVLCFCIDPIVYTPFFRLNNILSEFYYFADDTRGTRNYKKFDIGQFQHILYDNRFKNSTLNDFEPSLEKTHNLIFAGTIFQEKGPRRHLWDMYLKDVQSDLCSYYIPLRLNGINRRDVGNVIEEREMKLKESEFSELYESVIGSKHYAGSVLPEEMNNIVGKYKYGMLLRCVSANDSLNFRPVLYAYNNVLPLIDPQYDPAFLQIPKHIQEKLTVHNAQDIDRLIKYFNDNDEERLLVLRELRDLFRIDDYINNPNKTANEQIKKIIPEFSISKD